MHDRFTARYRGERFSLGYGACPILDDQQDIWKLLHPEEIGVHLTEGMMMDPEASVTALVFHHPDCVYFTAAESGPPPAQAAIAGHSRMSRTPSRAVALFWLAFPNHGVQPEAPSDVRPVH